MLYGDLPQRWKRKIKEYLVSKGVTDRDELWCYDFASDKVAEIIFDDGSSANFHSPLVIDAPELHEVGVFTEHCGYFLLDRLSTKITLKSD